MPVTVAEHQGQINTICDDGVQTVEEM